MKVMRIIFAAVILFALFGCSDEAPMLPEMFEGGFECRVSFEWDGEVYVADISRDGQRGGNMTLEFLEPRVMSGIKVSRIDGMCVIRLHDNEYTEVGNIGWLRLEELFFVEGRIVESRLDSSLGVSADRLTFRRSDGGEGQIYMSKDGEPLMICGSIFGRRTDARILKFRRK